MFLRYGAVASVALVAVVLLGPPGPSTLWQDDRPLLVLAAVALLMLLRDRDQSSAALVVVGGVLLLGGVYLVKNPRSAGTSRCSFPPRRSLQVSRLRPFLVDSAQPGSPSSRAWRRSVCSTPCPAAATTTCSLRSRAASREASRTVGSPS